jgi:hypothetical protein
MDTLSGHFSGHGSPEENGQDYVHVEEDAVREAPPMVIGQDERRMHVRAYNFWASLLADRSFPSIEDLDPENLPDFGPHSVLLDFTSGIEDPAVAFLGDKLGAECGTEGNISKLSDVPSRSLLSRITDHYLQIIANQAPIGFEAEFVNQRGATIMYRGILLPFSSDDDTIDFIYGVINWKELADQETTDELLREVNQALAAGPDVLRHEHALPEWADGPMDNDPLFENTGLDAPVFDETAFNDPAFGDLAFGDPVVGDPTIDDNVLDLVSPIDDGQFDADMGSAYDADDWAVPTFGNLEGLTPGIAEPAAPSASDPDQELILDEAFTGVSPLNETVSEEAQPAEDMSLADWLASARELAYAAQGSEDRSRNALYAAIGRAYDFALAAADEPTDMEELLADAGLKAQERAPMTPVVKLVFGANYDKTRLAEYASALTHAKRLEMPRGKLAEHLASSSGGLKGVVSLERKLRSEEQAKPVTARQNPRERLARKLRKLDHQSLDQVASQGSEFTLLVARRLADGQVVLLGEVGDDALLLDRAARKLLD